MVIAGCYGLTILLEYSDFLPHTQYGYLLRRPLGNLPHLLTISHARGEPRIGASALGYYPLCSKLSGHLVRSQKIQDSPHCRARRRVFIFIRICHGSPDGAGAHPASSTVHDSDRLLDGYSVSGNRTTKISGVLARSMRLSILSWVL